MVALQHRNRLTNDDTPKAGKPKWTIRRVLILLVVLDLWATSLVGAFVAGRMSVETKPVLPANEFKDLVKEELQRRHK